MQLTTLYFLGIAGKPSPYAFAVPHALALAEDKGALCVADRENGRITCFNVINGTYLSEIKIPEFGHRLFSVAYSPLQGIFI
jgi:peptidylamidoglycolate lyase